MTLTRDTAAGSITVAFAGGTSGIVVSSATPQPLGVASSGASGDASRADHVHVMPSAADVGAAAASHSHDYVRVLNGLTGTITIAGGTGVTVSTASSSITIAADGSYVLPTASAGVLGGIKVGSNLSITDGVLSATGGSGEDTVLRSFFLPPAPSSVTASAGNAQATVSWTAPTVLAQTPITDYVVQYSTHTASWTTFSDGTSTATSAIVTSLTNGSSYQFRVAGVNGIGTGSYSTATSSVTPIAGDPYFGSVALLLHMDGSGSTFVDSSPTPKEVAAVNATQSATQSRWGGKSAFFTGTSRLSSSTSSAFAFGTGDFCVEMWVYPTGTSAFQTLFSTRSSNTGEDSSNVFFGFNTGTLTPIVYTNGLVLSGSSSLSAETWSHIAFVRESGVISIYLNGTRIGNTSFTTSITGTNASVGLTQNSEHQFSGYIDDVRVTSSSRYTGSTITVPTAAFPDS